MLSTSPFLSCVVSRHTTEGPPENHAQDSLPVILPNASVGFARDCPSSVHFPMKKPSSPPASPVAACWAAVDDIPRSTQIAATANVFIQQISRNCVTPPARDERG